MNEVLLRKAMAMFETPEKWNAFLELVKQNGDIQNRWWRKLIETVRERERVLPNEKPDWDIKISGNWDIRWFIKEDGENSLAIHFWGEGLRICTYGGLDVDKLNKLIGDHPFSQIKTCFDRIDDNWSDTPAREIRNFSFGSPFFDGKFPDNATLSWYAGNRTDEFANQIIAKVRKFQTPEITALFKEINKECRKA